MPFENCFDFVSFCISDRRRKEIKVRELFATYNVDNDGLLKFEEFLRFYTHCSHERPNAVKANLKAYFCQKNDRFMYESDDEEEEE